MNDGEFAAGSPPALGTRVPQPTPFSDEDAPGVRLGDAPSRDPEQPPPSAPASARPLASAPPASQPQSQEQEEPHYHYVPRSLTVFHIYEETTGQRITHLPLSSEHEAEQLARLFNRNQAPPV